MLTIQRPTVEAIGEESNNTQKFAIGPLERGLGYTIGNSLRRTLLSSIPGAAITQVRFCLLYTSPSPRDATLSRMPSSA